MNDNTQMKEVDSDAAGKEAVEFLEGLLRAKLSSLPPEEANSAFMQQFAFWLKSTAAPMIVESVYVISGYTPQATVNRILVMVDINEPADDAQELAEAAGGKAQEISLAVSFGTVENPLNAERYVEFLNEIAVQSLAQRAFRDAD